MSNYLSRSSAVAERPRDASCFLSLSISLSHSRSFEMRVWRKLLLVWRCHYVFISCRSRLSVSDNGATLKSGSSCFMALFSRSRTTWPTSSLTLGDVNFR